eukprot:6181458-Prorocentrum_lima.AAC.2
MQTFQGSAPSHRVEEPPPQPRSYPRPVLWAPPPPFFKQLTSGGEVKRTHGKCPNWGRGDAGGGGVPKLRMARDRPPEYSPTWDFLPGEE